MAAVTTFAPQLTRAAALTSHWLVPANALLGLLTQVARKSSALHATRVPTVIQQVLPPLPLAFPVPQGLFLPLALQIALSALLVPILLLAPLCAHHVQQGRITAPQAPPLLLSACPALAQVLALHLG